MIFLKSNFVIIFFTSVVLCAYWRIIIPNILLNLLIIKEMLK
jgi:hypothetical protein